MKLVSDRPQAPLDGVVGFVLVGGWRSSAWHGYLPDNREMVKALSPARRSELRGEAHKLKPVVMVGDKGLTDEVLAEADRALKAHELIKVKAATNDREAREAWLAEICTRLEAHPVQQIGKVFVVYRANPVVEARGTRREAREEAKPPKKANTRKKRSRASCLVPRALLKKPAETFFTGTSRRRSRTPSLRPASAPPKRRPRTSR